MKAKDIMSKTVVTVKANATIKEVIDTMLEKRIDGMPVIDDHNKIIGMVSQKDILYKDVQPKLPTMIEILGGFIYVNGVKHYNEELKKLVGNKAGDIMEESVYTVTPETEVEHVAELMVEKGVSRVPVVEKDTLVGIIGRSDIVRYIKSMLE